MILYNLYGRSVGAGGAKGARRARLAYGLDVLKHFLGTFCVTKTITTVKQYCVKSRKSIFILILEHKWRC